MEKISITQKVKQNVQDMYMKILSLYLLSKEVFHTDKRNVSSGAVFPV